MSRSTLPLLDSSLYPQVWEQQSFIDGHSIWIALLSGSLTLDANAFTKQLLANETYQEWINATVFGRYIQRNFAAFYQQTEDSFNMDMPALFRNELMRHAQYMPMEQKLFVAGNIPQSVRSAKLLTSTVNPITAMLGAQNISQNALKSGQISHQVLILNQIEVVGKQVVGFPIRHNKRTSERIRNEVLVLDFNDLRLVNEQQLNEQKLDKQNIEANRAAAPIETTALIRYYELR